MMARNVSDQAVPDPRDARVVHRHGFTPYIAVLADDTVQVPREYVKNGEIVLNISPLATSRLQARQRIDRVQGALRRRRARDHRADRPRDRDLRARERPGHGFRGPARGGSRRSRAARSSAPARGCRWHWSPSKAAPGNALELVPESSNGDQAADEPPGRHAAATWRAAKAHSHQVAAAKRPCRHSSAGRAAVL